MKKRLLWIVYFVVSCPFLVLAEETLRDVVAKGFHDVCIALIQALIPVLAILVGLILKTLLSSIKIGFVRNLVRKWVLAAYQKYASGDHAAKYTEVAEKIHAKFPALSTAEIKDLIEEAVAQVKIDLNRKFQE